MRDAACRGSLVRLVARMPERLPADTLRVVLSLISLVPLVPKPASTRPARPLVTAAVIRAFVAQAHRATQMQPTAEEAQVETQLARAACLQFGVAAFEDLGHGPLQPMLQDDGATRLPHSTDPFVWQLLHQPNHEEGGRKEGGCWVHGP